MVYFSIIMVVYFSIIIYIHKKYTLIQLLEIKIILGAAGTFVVELKHAHVLLSDLYSSVVERVCGMLASGDNNDHIGGQHCSIRTFDAFGRYAKDSAHRLLVS